MLVYNKCDAVFDSPFYPMEKDAVSISAKMGVGIDAFLEKLSKLLQDGKKDVYLYIPYDKAKELDGVYRNATVKNVSYEEDFIRVLANMDQKGQGMYRAYIRED